MRKAYGQDLEMFTSRRSERKRSYSGEQSIPEVKRRRYNEEVKHAKKSSNHSFLLFAQNSINFTQKFFL